MALETIGVKAVAEGAAQFVSDLNKMNQAETSVGTSAAKLGTQASTATHSITAEGQATATAGKQAQTAAGEHDKLASSTAHAATAAKEHGSATEHLGGQLKALIPTLTGLGAGFAAAFEFKEAIGSAAELGGAVSKMSRELGISSEDASKLKFAAQELGIPFDNAERSFVKFEKGLAGVGDAEDLTFQTGKALKDNIKALGIEVTNADGTARPFNAILNDLSDRFKEMPDGVQKTALATQLFGKSGAELLPLLNKGSEGIKEFGDEAEKMGLVLDGETTAALKKQKMEMREFQAALEGIEVQIGIALIPVLHTFTDVGTNLAVLLNQDVIPAIETTSDVLGKIKDVTWGQLPDETQSFVLVMVALAVALPPVISGLTAAAVAAKAYVVGTEGATAASGGLVAMFAGPQGLVLGAVALGYAIYKLADAFGVFGDSANSARDASIDYKFVQDRLNAAIAAGGDRVETQKRILDEYIQGLYDSQHALQGLLDTNQYGNDSWKKAADLFEANVNAIRGLKPSYDELKAIVGDNAALQEIFKDDLNAGAQALEDSGKKAEATKGPIEEWTATLAAADGTIGDVDKAIQGLIDTIDKTNPAVHELSAQNSFLKLAIDGIKNSTTDLTADQQALIDKYQAQIDSNDKAIAGHKSYADAIRGAQAAVSDFVGPYGMGALLKAFQDNNESEATQVDTLERVNEAYVYLGQGSVQQAITGLGQLKSTMSPEEWATLAEAVGPKVVEKITTAFGPGPLRDGLLLQAHDLGLTTGTQLGVGGEPAALAAGTGVGSQFGQGIVVGIEEWNTASQLAAAGIIDDATAYAKAHQKSSSPSKMTAEEIGLPFAQGIAVGIASGAPVVLDSLSTLADAMGSNFMDVIATWAPEAQQAFATYMAGVILTGGDQLNDDLLQLTEDVRPAALAFGTELSKDIGDGMDLLTNTAGGKLDDFLLELNDSISSGKDLTEIQLKNMFTQLDTIIQNNPFREDIKKWAESAIGGMVTTMVQGKGVADAALSDLLYGLLAETNQWTGQVVTASQIGTQTLINQTEKQLDTWEKLLEKSLEAGKEMSSDQIEQIFTGMAVAADTAGLPDQLQFTVDNALAEMHKSLVAGQGVANSDIINLINILINGLNSAAPAIAAAAANAAGAASAGFIPPLSQAGGAIPYNIGGGQTGLQPTDYSQIKPGFYNPTTGLYWNGQNWQQGVYYPGSEQFTDPSYGGTYGTGVVQSPVSYASVSRDSGGSPGAGSITIDMRGATLTGTVEQNQRMITRAVNDALAQQTGRGATNYGVVGNVRR